MLFSSIPLHPCAIWLCQSTGILGQAKEEDHESWHSKSHSWSVSQWQKREYNLGNRVGLMDFTPSETSLKSSFQLQPPFMCNSFKGICPTFQFFLFFFFFWIIACLTTEEHSYICEGAIHHETKCREHALYQNVPSWKEKAPGAYHENSLCLFQQQRSKNQSQNKAPKHGLRMFQGIRSGRKLKGCIREIAATFLPFDSGFCIAKSRNWKTNLTIC